jgi:hypothetical protein
LLLLTPIENIMADACSDWRASDIIKPDKAFPIRYYITLKSNWFYEYPGFLKKSEPGKFSFDIPHGKTIRLALIGADNHGIKKFLIPARRDIEAFFRHDWSWSKNQVSGGFFSNIWKYGPKIGKNLTCVRKIASPVLLSPEEAMKFKRPVISPHGGSSEKALESLTEPKIDEKPLTCNESPALGFAFARVSPLKVFTPPDFKKLTGHIDVDFGRGYPITQKKMGKVRLCIKENNHWVKRSHIVSKQSTEWVSVSPTHPTKRPKVNLWRSRERLSAYLSGSNFGKASPAYEEFITDSLPTPIEFPIYQMDFMEIQIRNIQVEVASLLVPFPTEAIRKYQQLQLDRKKQHNTTMVILVDVSGSTVGFINLFLNRLNKTYTKSKLPKLDNIMLLEFGGDGSVSKQKIISFRKLTSYSWNVRSAPVVQNGENKAILNAITLAAKQVKRQGVKPPLLILAGGDVNIQAIKELDAFGYTWIVQLTPELQDALKKSADSLGKTAKFVEFSPDNAVFLTEDMAKNLEFENEKTFINTPDYSSIANIFTTIGMLPLLPKNLETEELATLPNFVSKESDWFAINLWTVVNGELLKFKKVPE